MKSEHFKQFGIPVADCEIEPGFHPDFKVPYLWFRSTGNPLIGLDLGGANKLRQLLVHDGDAAATAEIDRHIEQAHCLK